jgi:peptidoglycan hydrolase-like protein with peptidoglycan-binding domain
MRKLIISLVAVVALVVGGATSASASKSAKDISRTSHSSVTAVKCVQIALNAHYGSGTVATDGIFGAKTESAVIRLQNDSDGDLRTDGIVGNNTGERLWQSLKKQNIHTECYSYLPTLT